MLIKNSKSQALVAHNCNPSYEGGRDQEDRSLKPAQADTSVRPYLEKTLYKNRAAKDQKSYVLPHMWTLDQGQTQQGD
jgi:hypothetical protein